MYTKNYKNKIKMKFKSMLLTAVAMLGMTTAAMTQNLPQLNFVNRIGGSGYEQGYGLDIDANSNSYVSGAFSGTVDFDHSPNSLAQL